MSWFKFWSGQDKPKSDKVCETAKKHEESPAVADHSEDKARASHDTVLLHEVSKPIAEDTEKSAPPFVLSSAIVVPEYKPGDVIAGTYEVTAVRHGGMATVYIAKHREWQMDLAVKIPNPYLTR